MGGVGSLARKLRDCLTFSLFDVIKTRNQLSKGIMCSGVELAQSVNGGLKGDELCEIRF